MFVLQGIQIKSCTYPLGTIAYYVKKSLSVIISSSLGNTWYMIVLTKFSVSTTTARL